jgi:acyl carrier protein
MNDAEVLSLVREAIAFAEPKVKTATLSPTDTIADLGINSISVLEIVGYLEDKLGVRFPDDELAHLNTVGGLCGLIRSHAVTTTPSA